MDAWVWIVIIVAAVVVLGLVAWMLGTRMRTERLQQRFGPEYERTVEQAESRKEAESELRARMKRRQELEIQPVSPESADRYKVDWRDVQARFVDQPNQAVKEADRLVTRLMEERGYPTEDFEQRVVDISVDHPRVVENYRGAHAVWFSNEQGKAGTEDLRQAMIHYRSLFEELLEREEAPEERAASDEREALEERAAPEEGSAPEQRETTDADRLETRS
jgi:hypothetical protein